MSLRIFRPLALFALTLTLALPSLAQNGQREVSVQDVWQRFSFFAQGAGPIRWMANDNFYTVLQDEYLLKYDIQNEAVAETLATPGDLKDPTTGRAFTPDSYVLSPAEDKVLFTTERQSIYRRSSKEVCYVLDLKTKQVQLLHEGAQVGNALFDPTGSRVGYTFDNNLYVHSLATNSMQQITKDGEYNAIINGHTDWVYEEEFALTRAFAFSPEGDRIAFYRFDEREVPLFQMALYGGLYPVQQQFKYPKAGEKNADIRLFVHHLGEDKTVEFDLGPEKDIYIPRIQWTADNNLLAIIRMNRLQNRYDLLLGDATTGKTTTAITETSDTWLDFDDSTIDFLKDGKHLVLQSERDGYNHLYLYTVQGELVRQITTGEWEVSSYYGVDEARELVYFQSTEVAPEERHVYSITLKGKKKKQLTSGAGMHSASFSSAFNYYRGTHSSIAPLKPNEVTLYKADGTALRTLVNNNRLKQRLEGYKLAPQEFFSFTASHGTELRGWIIKPKDMDESKQHPVLMFVYGGPGSQSVDNNYDGLNYFWYQTLVQQGYIVACVDGRGTGARGRDFEHQVYRQLGKMEVEDQVEGAKYLGSLPYVDASRVGIFGWSYGGFMAANCIAQHPDVFKAAISVAPVANWRLYDTIYTERYMGLPSDNSDGYDDNSPLTHMAGVPDGSLLLVHGTADDNVHYQNSIMLVNALIVADVDFDLMIYPNQNHGIFGQNTRNHLFSKMNAFLFEKL